MLNLNKNTEMKHLLFHFADGIGAGTVVLSVYFNLTEWLKAFDYNKWMLGLTTFFGLIWVILKVINTRLANKKLRLENKKLKG
jgi:hypothetical protein